MLNSLSNNPGNGNLDGLKAKLSKANTSEAPVETIIKEVYEDEPEDYDYEPQIREVDEEEIRNLSAIRQETEVDKRVYWACAAFVVAALIGGLIGYALASVSATNSDIHRKASVARTINNTMDAKFSGFDNFKKAFSSGSKDTFNEATFDDKVANYNKYDFMLDISSEVTSEAVLLLDRSGANPLEGLRVYSSKTMLLTQLLSIHVNETHADADAILELQSNGDSAKVTFAMQVIPEAIYYLGTDAPRNQYANGVTTLYTYRNYVNNDDDLAQAFADMKSDARGAYQQQKLELRTYVSNAKKKKNDDSAEDELPSRLIYNVLDRNGRNIPMFADEVVLVDRSLLFGKSANALERYKRRTNQINKLIKEIDEVREPIAKDLKVFIDDDK